MDYVTDAHSIIWYFMKDARLSQNALAKFEETIDQGTIIVPTIVLAEIMYISQKGRVPITFEDTLLRLEEYDNFCITPLDLNILKVAANIGNLEMHDRLIVATALYFDVPLILFFSLKNDIFQNQCHKREIGQGALGYWGIGVLGYWDFTPTPSPHYLCAHLLISWANN